MPTPTRAAREPLSIKLINETTLELIDRDGLDALSMRSLAKALSANPMAVYHHIPNKAALLEGVYETVLADLFAQDETQTAWQDILKQLLRRFRMLATRHPKVFPGLIASSHSSQAIQSAVDVILGLLLDAGLNPKTTVQASDALLAFITGFVLLELNSAPKPAPEMTAERLSFEQTLVNTKRLLQDLASNQFADSFEFGLQLLISGIEASLPSAGRSSQRRPRN
jgi:TetR/AcrR family transcriptional regulator, tetracycline repressor protein